MNMHDVHVHVHALLIYLRLAARVLIDLALQPLAMTPMLVHFALQPLVIIT